MKILINPPEKEAELIKRASVVEKRSNTNFILKSALDKAKLVLEGVSDE